MICISIDIARILLSGDVKYFSEIKLLLFEIKKKSNHFYSLKIDSVMRNILQANQI